MELLHNALQVAYSAFCQQKKVLLPDDYSEEARRFGVYVGTDELHLIAIGKHEAVLAAKSAGYWAARMAYGGDAYTEYYKLMLEEAVCQIAVALGNNKIDEINIVYEAAMEDLLSFE